MARQSARTGLDLNQAIAEELSQIEGISAERAKILVQHRKKVGTFGSWEDVEEVPGFGVKLVEKLKSATTLSEGQRVSDAGDEEEQEEDGMGTSEPEEQARASSAEPPEEASAPEEAEEDEGDEDDDVDDSEIDALMALAQMDAEAAASYETAIELIADTQIQKTLKGFAADHHRHVKDISRLIAEKGLELAMEAPPPQSSVFNMLESAIATMGDRPALMALFGTEQFTNATYEIALELVTDPDAAAMLEQNYADEQRHIAWLAEQKDQVGEDEDVDASPMR